MEIWWFAAVRSTPRLAQGVDGKDTGSGAVWLYAAWYVIVLLTDLCLDQNMSSITLYPLRSCPAGGGWCGVLVPGINDQEPWAAGTRHQARTAKLNNASFEWKF